MNYSGTEFFRLIEEIEDQGGVQLDELHEVRVIDIPKQSKSDKAQTIRGQKLCGCDEAALFAIPFESLHFSETPADDQLVFLGNTETVNAGRDKGEEPALHAMPIGEQADTIKVCAVDDAIGAWPRFKGTREEDE